MMSSSLREDNRISRLLWRQQNFCFLTLVTCSLFWSTKFLILVMEMSIVLSSMFAKQTRNHPGSEQWNEEPGETFSLTSLIITLHNAISASNVFSFKRWRKSIHKNNPPLPFKYPIPTCMKNMNKRLNHMIILLN